MEIDKESIPKIESSINNEANLRVLQKNRYEKMLRLSKEKIDFVSINLNSFKTVTPTKKINLKNQLSQFKKDDDSKALSLEKVALKVPPRRNMKLKKPSDKSERNRILDKLEAFKVLSASPNRISQHPFSLIENLRRSNGMQTFVKRAE